MLTDYFCGKFIQKLNELSNYLKEWAKEGKLDGYAELLYRIMTNHSAKCDWTSVGFFEEMRDDVFMNTEQTRELMTQALKTAIH